MSSLNHVYAFIFVNSTYILNILLLIIDKIINQVNFKKKKKRNAPFTLFRLPFLMK